MDYLLLNISYAAFCKKLEQHHQVSLGDPNSTDHTSKLSEIADSFLLSRDERYRAIYYFDGIDDDDFILVKGDTDKDTSIFSPKPADKRESVFSEHVRGLEALRGLNGAERFVIEWARIDIESAENDYAHILSYYSLSDCILQAQSDSEYGVLIWVEHFYDPATRFEDVELDGYVRDIAGWIETYPTIAEAQAEIDWLNSIEYTLSTGEIKRPRYTITYSPNNTQVLAD